MPTLEERITTIEEALYRAEIMRRPAPPPRVYPEVEAENCVWVDLGKSGMVQCRYTYRCAVCGEESEATIQVKNSTPQPFTALKPCKTEDETHTTRVKFYRQHE